MYAICSSFDYIPSIFVLVMETIYTGINFIYSITLLSGNTAVICGSDALVRKLNSYNLHTGVELNGLNLKNAWGVTEVKLGEKMVLSVAHRSVKRFIGFIIGIILLIISPNVN